MKYTTITTPDNIEIDFRLAGAGSRIAAAVIDTVIQSVIFLAVILIFILAFVGNNFINIVSYNYSGWAVAFLLLFLFLVFFGYFIACEMLTNGRSIGKIIFKLRVIRENGQPISFTQSLIRNLFRNTIDLFGIGIVSMLLNEKYKRLGDIVASTIVVSENPSQIITESLVSSNLLDEGLSTVSVGDYALTDDEYYFLKEYISRKDTFISSGEELKEITKAYLSKKFEVDVKLIDDEFIYTLYTANAYRVIRSYDKHNKY